MKQYLDKGDLFNVKDTIKPMMYFEKTKQKKKCTKKIMLFCLVAACLYGCKKPEEEISTLLSTSPAITEVAPQEEIPIDAEHFSDEVFRKYISGMYDLDNNGALSKSEREAVKEIIWDEVDIDISKDKFPYDYIEVNRAVLDGLEYFSKLDCLIVDSAQRVILKNHPSIRRFGCREGNIETVLIENCPVLEKIGAVEGEFHGDFIVKNCENLRIFNVHTVDFNTLVFEETPRVVIFFEAVGIEAFSTDADAVINADSSTLHRILGEEIYRLTEDGKLSFGLNESIHWTNVDESSVVSKEQFLLPAVTEEDFTYVDVQITEKEEENVSEQREKTWDICVDLKEYFRIFGGPVHYTVYAKEKPERSKIVLRPIGGVDKILPLEYSPNKGVFFLPSWILEVVYRNGENEEILGKLRHKQLWEITPDGTINQYKFGVDCEAGVNFWKVTHIYRACIDLEEDPSWYGAE